MRTLTAILFPPLACACLLAGVALDSSRRPSPATAEPYHAQARAAIEGIPHRIGRWVSEKDEPLIPAATNLLRPNATLNRSYSDYNAAHPMQASLMVIQCKDAEDMGGHFPPNCYPGNGMRTVARQPTQWTVDGQAIHGVRYVFASGSGDHVQHTIVYNFLIVPGTGVVADMEAVNRAAADYKCRYYGAAQVQVVFREMASELNPAERQQNRLAQDQAFLTLMQPLVPVIRELSQRTK